MLLRAVPRSDHGLQPFAVAWVQPDFNALPHPQQARTSASPWESFVSASPLAIHATPQSARQRCPPPLPEGVSVAVEDVAPILTVQPDVAASLQLRDLEAALTRLPEEQQQVILLVGLEGLRYEEMATILGVPIGTVRSRLSRGRDSLRCLMEWARRRRNLPRPQRLDRQRAVRRQSGAHRLPEHGRPRSRRGQVRAPVQSEGARHTT